MILTLAAGCPVEVHEVRGDRPGPTLTVLGGVHGDELEGVAAARMFLRAVPARLRRGRVRVVPVANPPAFAARQRTSPLDGENLARVFPGSADGGPSHQLAAALTDGAIAGSDLLVDLHSAGAAYRMPVFAGYVAGCATGERSGAAARAFGAPILWEHANPNPGRSLTAADRLGVPAIYVEGSGGGGLRGRDVDLYVAGLHGLLDWLGMTDPGDRAGPPVRPAVLVGGDGDVDASVPATVDGWCVTRVQVGEEVAEGQLLAEILDGDGGVVEAVRSPRAGSVMMLRHRAEIRRGEGVAMLGPVFS